MPAPPHPAHLPCNIGRQSVALTLSSMEIGLASTLDLGLAGGARLVVAVLLSSHWWLVACQGGSRQEARCCSRCCLWAWLVSGGWRARGSGPLAVLAAQLGFAAPVVGRRPVATRGGLVAQALVVQLAFLAVAAGRTVAAGRRHTVT